MRIEPNRYDVHPPNPELTQPGKTALGCGSPPGPSRPELSAGAAALLHGRTQESEIRNGFQAQFTQAARDRDTFHALLKASFGPGYDQETAERIRRQALAGDWSWLPKIRFVSADTLQGANGAYDSESSTVLLNAEKKADSGLMAGTLAHEVGHHLDTLLNGKDTVGEEGELFRRLLCGQTLTARELAEIRADDGRGIIRIGGKSVAVEFWNPLKSAAKAARKAASSVAAAAGRTIKAASAAVASVGEHVVASGVTAARTAISTAGAAVVASGRAVADSVLRSARSVASMADDLGGRVAGVPKFVARSLWDITGRSFANVLQGRFSEAWGCLGRGVDNLVLRLPGRVIDATLDVQANALQSAVALIPSERVREALGGYASRISDAGRSLGMGAYGTVVGVVRGAIEAGSGIVGGLRQCAQGDFRGGLTRLGTSLLWPVQSAVDRTLMMAGSTASALQTLAYLEPPGRKLSEAEIAQLRTIFGDGIDYRQVRIKEGNAGLFSLNRRPFVHGNTVYLKNDGNSPTTLAHEMVHVWQHQNGGTDYMSKSLAAQAIDGRGAYDWRRSVPGTPWRELGPEQQAAFIQTAFAQQAFDQNPPAFPSGFPRPNGVSLDQLNAYLVEALAELRQGHGAP
jgi:hypothetical protein